MPSPQARYWLLTVPHVGDGDEPEWTKTLPEGVRYLKGQKEVGSDTGYVHWQVSVGYSMPVTLAVVKRTFGQSTHCERSRSARVDEYVWKDESAVPGSRFELGIKPVRRCSKADWDGVWESARTGQFQNIESSIRVQHYRTLRTIRADHAQPVAMERSCVVYWGATGTGKSRSAWSEAGLEAYPKDPRTKWWDGYLDQENVVIDEFRGSIDPSHMLRWLDRYPVLVEIKGSSVPLKAKKIWIMSNISPDEWYPDLDEETKKALRRRMQIKHFVTLYYGAKRESRIAAASP